MCPLSSPYKIQGNCFCSEAFWWVDPSSKGPIKMYIVFIVSEIRSGLEKTSGPNLQDRRTSQIPQYNFNIKRRGSYCETLVHRSQSQTVEHTYSRHVWRPHALYITSNHTNSPSLVLARWNVTGPIDFKLKAQWLQATGPLTSSYRATGNQATGPLTIKLQAHWQSSYRPTDFKIQVHWLQATGPLTIKLQVHWLQATGPLTIKLQAHWLQATGNEHLLQQHIIYYSSYLKHCGNCMYHIHQHSRTLDLPCSGFHRILRLNNDYFLKSITCLPS
jgi:hypothetical protein